MNIAIYCGSAFGNDEIYENATKKLAQKLAQKGINILHIKKQLGHRKLETTMRYAHISDTQRYQETIDIAF